MQRSLAWLPCHPGFPAPTPNAIILTHNLQIPVEAEDVRAERLRVEALPPGGNRAEAIVIRDLHKTFPASGGGGCVGGMESK